MIDGFGESGDRFGLLVDAVEVVAFAEDLLDIRPRTLERHGLFPELRAMLN